MPKKKNTINKKTPKAKPRGDLVANKQTKFAALSRNNNIQTPSNPFTPLHSP